MREYEIVYIFRSNFTPEEIEAKVERYHAVLTGDGNGQITAVEQWGKRQLAYPIEKQPNGYYLVAQFTADPAVLPELERMLKLEEDLLRYLIVLSEGELPIAGSMQSEMDDRFGAGGPPRRDSDDEQRPSETAGSDSETAGSDAEEGEASADTETVPDDDAAADVGDGDVASDDVTEADEDQGDEATSEVASDETVADEDGSAADGGPVPDEGDGEPAGDEKAGEDGAGDDVEEEADDDAEEEADDATEKED